jgi:uncharacterized protein (DUF1330 family)
MLVVVIVDVAAADVARFQVYEARVLSLLARHGGELEQRLVTGDGASEVHVIRFADQAGYDAYVADPERLAAKTELAPDLEIAVRVLFVEDASAG